MSNDLKEKKDRKWKENLTSEKLAEWNEKSKWRMRRYRERLKQKALGKV